MVKVTFSLDEPTVIRLRRVSARLHLPQSQVVRQAIDEFVARADKLSERDRIRILGAIDAALEKPPTRTAAAVDREIQAITESRRLSGRRRSERARS